MYRTHLNNELKSTHIDQTITICGWVHRRRDHGGLIFIDLRDRYGLTQIVFDPEHEKKSHAVAEKLRPEYVIQISGKVSQRPEGEDNPKMATGEIEVICHEVIIHNSARTPPFEIDQDKFVGEEIRLEYRYLDLRRDRIRNNIILRHEVVRFMRNFMSENGFLEIETPMLVKGTPEGSREYLVPSRLYHGNFYVLPQSPQQMKQLLMVAGMDKYFQVARCFRDEDQRGDRQPEFTQLDVEMSFVEQEDVMRLVEDMFTRIVAEVVPHKRLLASPWPRLTYKEAMARFGKDNPDLRFGMELRDVSDLAVGSGFHVFESAVVGKGHVRGLNAPGLGDYSRKQIDELTEYVKKFGAKGLAYLAITSEGEERSSFARFLSPETLQAFKERLEAKPGDLLLFVADQPGVVFESLGRLRAMLGDRLGLRDPDVLAFCWIIDFPFVVWNEEERRWDPSHHLFTAPMLEDIPLLDSEPGKARGQQYDLVINDYEVGGGSIRIHNRQLQEKVFTLIGLDPEVARERFGHMLEAFEFGTPPHRGIAPGIDRPCLILAGEPNIR